MTMGLIRASYGTTDQVSAGFYDEGVQGIRVVHICADSEDLLNRLSILSATFLPRAMTNEHWIYHDEYIGPPSPSLSSQPGTHLRVRVWQTSGEDGGFREG